MPVGANEYRVIARSGAIGDPTPDVGRDPVRLLGAGRERLEADRRGRPVATFRPEPLGHAGLDLEAIRIVEPDEPMGGVQDGFERPIVAPEHDRPGARIARPEAEDVVDRRAPERVDRLVIVTDDGDVAMGLGQEIDELRLRPVRVLELIDEDVPEAAGDGGARGRRVAHESQGQGHLVAEVHEPVRRQQLLVASVGSGQFALTPAVLRHRRRGGIARRGEGVRLGRHPLGVIRVRRRRDVLVLAPAEQRGQGSQEPGRVPERSIEVEVELEEVLAQEDHDFRARQHADIRRQPELQCVVADEAVTERVEGRDRRIRVAVRHELVDPDRHLGRGLVREGEGEDLRGLRPAGGDQPRDAAGDDLGLAGPGPGDDEQRAVLVGHRPKLLGIEAPEQLLHARRATGCPGDGRVHDRHEVAPGRDLLERSGAAPSGADGRSGHDGGHVRTIADARDT